MMNEGQRMRTGVLLLGLIPGLAWGGECEQTDYVPGGSCPAVEQDSTGCCPPVMEVPAVGPARVERYQIGADGLKYADLTVGSGDEVMPGDKVRLFYTGFLEDGTPFDASAPGRPLMITVGQKSVIAGLDRALVGLREGGRRQVVIPPELGYGSRVVGPIPANSTLTFEVQVEKVRLPTRPAADASWTTLPSGLRMRDVVVGSGAEVTSGDEVTCDYTGWIDGGAVFDSSITRGQPATFPIGVGRLIKGWDEGIVGMRAGGTRQLWIPSELGYGARSRPNIPGRSDLVFEITVHSVN